MFHLRRQSASKRQRCRIEPLESRRLLTTITWTGSGGTDNWFTADNWSTHSVPGVNDDAVIGTVATPVIVGTGDASVRSLTSSGGIVVLGRTFTVAQASTTSADF